MARPHKKINQNQFESLCALQCTLEEICGFFECCTDTLESWCKRTYKQGFSEVFKEKRGNGKISLRRAQFRLAQKNANMAIWLGKQYLGQAETKEFKDPYTHDEDDPITIALREEFEDGAEFEAEENP